MSKAAKKAHAFERRLKKKELAIQERAELFGLMRAGMSSPVLAGTAAFLGVHFIETLTKASVAASDSAPSGLAPGGGQGPPLPSGYVQPTQQVGSTKLTTSNFMYIFGHLFTGILGQNAQGQGVAQQAISGLGTAAAADLGAIFKNLDFSALKMVILIYIATGGNLAGLLASQGGISGLAEGFISKLGLATVAG